MACLAILVLPNEITLETILVVSANEGRIIDADGETRVGVVTHATADQSIDVLGGRWGAIAWQFHGSRTLPRFGNSIAAFWFLHLVMCGAGAAFCGVRGLCFLVGLPLAVGLYCVW